MTAGHEFGSGMIFASILILVVVMSLRSLFAPSLVLYRLNCWDRQTDIYRYKEHWIIHGKLYLPETNLCEVTR